MTKAEIVQEVIDRGFDYSTSSRIGRYVENAVQGICAYRGLAWPFLEVTKTGEAPMEITDLRKILSVKDTTLESTLRGVGRRWVVDTFGNLTDTGSPEYFYLENKTLNVYPVSTNELSVRYTKIPLELGDSDTPVIPSEWHHLVVDRAIVDCLRDDDEYLEARALRAEVREAIDTEMVPALFNRNLQNSLSVVRTGTWGDYIQ